MKIILFCVCCLTLIGCDRITKNIARERLADHEPISYFHDFFRLEYIENTGAFLSLGDSLPRAASFWLLSIVPLAFLVWLFIYAIRRSDDMPFTKMLLWGCIFAGGVGNILDRILFDRRVSDFMNLGIKNLRTGIFNFADLYITIGVLCLLLFYRNNMDRRTPA